MSSHSIPPGKKDGQPQDDDDLDALLSQLSGDDSSQKSDAPADSDSAGSDDLDALLKSLGDDSADEASSGGGDTGGSTDSADDSGDSGGDDDLDALLKGLSGDDSDAASSGGGADDDASDDSGGGSGDDDDAGDNSDAAAADGTADADDGGGDSGDAAAGNAPPPKAAPAREPVKAAAAGKPSLTVGFGARPAPKAHAGSKQPLVIALLGDFTGRASRGVREPLAGRAGHAVDIDSIDDLYGKLSPALSIKDPGAPGTQVGLEFSELDDFHPDQIYKKIPGIASLRALRPQLLGPGTAAKAAAQLQKLLGVPLPKAPRRSTAARSGETAGQTLERLLGKKSAAPAAKTAPAAAKTAAPAKTAVSAVEALIKQAVGDNVVKNPTAHQKELAAALDAALVVRMRAILADPRFQALESAWRSIDMLVRTFDDGDRIKLLVYDVSKEEIAADIGAPLPPDDAEPAADAGAAPPADPAFKPAATGLHKMIRDTIAENPWMAAFSLHTFGDSPADLALAGKAAAVFAASGTPLIAAGHPFALGCAGFSRQPDPDDWTKLKDTAIGAALKALRESPAAAHLALAAPRFLLRLPYGRTTDPVDAFAFEEIESPDQHEQYLWASPAVLIAQLYIERFKQKGWAMDLAAGQTVGDLPVHHFKHNGESCMTPCAEAWLTERAAVAIASQGLIPVLSIKNSGSVRIGRINSIAAGDAPLALRVPRS
ncbi:MAG: type VI secretion system contractile sheath large subunit [Opitutaceae bacterium]|jgi:type VI secretion system ImpC/EvpB family protein/type VI secretion system ImpB/VipA family protein|nr:type VI secretion system contractile sheath large subunit [Opitutaceae bacterium]